MEPHPDLQKEFAVHLPNITPEEEHKLLLWWFNEEFMCGCSVDPSDLKFALTRVIRREA